MHSKSLLLLCLLLTACGVKGPLKLPSEMKDKTKPVAAQTQPPTSAQPSAEPDAHQEKFERATNPENLYQQLQPRP